MTDKTEFDLNNIKINDNLEKLRDTPNAVNCVNDVYESFDGTKLFFRTWKPSQEIKKIIVVAHGMAGHGEFFVLLADKLVSHGIMVIAPDYRNHGYSEGKKGDLKRFKSILKDLYYFIQFIKEKYPNKPIFLLGESMGGCVSVSFAKEFQEGFNSLAGLILFAPAVKLNLPKIFWFGIGILSPIILLLRLIIPSKPIIPAKGREEQGIRNPIHQQYDKEDPIHLEKVSIRYLLQLFKYIRKTKKVAPNIMIPSLIFQGTHDKGISPNGVRSFYNFIGSKDKKVMLIEEGYHALIADPGFQEKWPILIDWIKSH